MRAKKRSRSSSLTVTPSNGERTMHSSKGYAVSCSKSFQPTQLHQRRIRNTPHPRCCSHRWPQNQKEPPHHLCRRGENALLLLSQAMGQAHKQRQKQTQMVTHMDAQPPRTLRSLQLRGKRLDPLRWHSRMSRARNWNDESLRQRVSSPKTNNQRVVQKSSR